MQHQLGVARNPRGLSSRCSIIGAWPRLCRGPVLLQPGEEGADPLDRKLKVHYGVQLALYVDVLERIETQGAGSVWTLFFDSLFARRIAMASLALALLLGVYVVSSEQIPEQQMELVSDLVSDLPRDLPGVFSDYGQPRLVTSAPDQNAVLVNLVTYRER